jgi:DNA polymerase III sliding clamp (beta) subunit (PCNA family)
MRLPGFIKAVVGCTDSESSRFSLGGVKCEHTAGASCVTATNGRLLVNVSYPDDHGDEDAEGFDVIVEGKSLSKAFAYSHHKRAETVLAENDGKAVVSGANGIAHANLCEGRYPRWRDVFGDTAEHQQVILDPALVIDVLKVFKDAGINSVSVYAHGDNRPVYFAGTAPTGEVVRAIVMHKEGDKAPMPDEYRPSEPECSESSECSEYADESAPV